MDAVNLNTMLGTGLQKVRSGAEARDRESLANEMKTIRKARLRRQVLQDPSLARKLVATEASPVYNARGDLIQSVASGGLGI